jgi:hypothetical protein
MERWLIRISELEPTINLLSFDQIPGTGREVWQNEA